MSPSQWFKIRTHSPSWCQGGRSSHLHTHWSLTGGLWAAVVPRWKIPGQWRQWQPGVCLATCAGGWCRQQQSVSPLLEWTSRSCQGEGLHTWTGSWAFSQKSEMIWLGFFFPLHCTYLNQNSLNVYASSSAIVCFVNLQSPIWVLGTGLVLLAAKYPCIWRWYQWSTHPHLEREQWFLHQLTRHPVTGKDTLPCHQS